MITSFINKCRGKLLLLLIVLFLPFYVTSQSCSVCVKKCCNDKKYKFKDKVGNRYGAFERSDQESINVYFPGADKRFKKIKKGFLYYVGKAWGGNITFVQDTKNPKEWIATWYEQYDWDNTIRKTIANYHFYCYSCKDLKEMGLVA